MLKLLNKITNCVFVLPDERAIDMFKKNKERFEILDGGYIEEEKPREVTVQELVMRDERKEELKKEEDSRKIENMNTNELKAIAIKLGIKYTSKMNKKKLIEEINKNGEY